MIRVVIADDHRIVSEALRHTLEDEPGVEVVGVASDGREAVRLVRTLSPDVVILDVTMPELSGIEAARQIRQIRPDTKIIALSMHSDRRYVTGMLEAGVCGYLVKDCALEELATALKAAVAGHVYLSPHIAGVVVDDLRASAASAQTAAERTILTGREREVLQLITEGYSVREIAAKLHLSAKTVDGHRRRLMTKLDIDSIAGLTKYAVREGITSLED